MSQKCCGLYRKHKKVTYLTNFEKLSLALQLHSPDFTFLVGWNITTHTAIHLPNLPFLFFLSHEWILSPLPIDQIYSLPRYPSPGLPWMPTVAAWLDLMFLPVFPFSPCPTEWSFQNENQIITLQCSQPPTTVHGMETHNPSPSASSPALVLLTPSW